VLQLLRPDHSNLGKTNVATTVDVVHVVTARHLLPRHATRSSLVLQIVQRYLGGLRSLPVLLKPLTGYDLAGYAVLSPKHVVHVLSNFVHDLRVDMLGASVAGSEPGGVVAVLALQVRHSLHRVLACFFRFRVLSRCRRSFLSGH